MAIRTLRDSGSDYLISNNIDGGAYSCMTEDCVVGGMGDEFALHTNGLQVTFKKDSQAIIGGNAFWLTEDYTVTLPANQSYFILCARIDPTAANGQTGSFVCTQWTEAHFSTNENPSNGKSIRDITLYAFSTNDTSITSSEDLRNTKGIGEQNHIFRPGWYSLEDIRMSAIYHFNKIGVSNFPETDISNWWVHFFSIKNAEDTYMRNGIIEALSPNATGRMYIGYVTTDSAGTRSIEWYKFTGTAV